MAFLFAVLSLRLFCVPGKFSLEKQIKKEDE